MSDHFIDLDCPLKVKDGKLYCTKHETTDIEQGNWDEHEGHEKFPLKMYHVLYTATLCTDCGVVLVDEEQ